MYDSDELTLDTAPQQAREIDLPVLAEAQDGSEILFAVARLLEQRHGTNDAYACLVRKTAHAVRDITDQLRPWVVANEEDALLRNIWQQTADRDSVISAGLHQSELAPRLGIGS